LAVEKLNAAGALLGRRIELIPIDTASEASRATNELERALEQHPSATAGIGYTNKPMLLTLGGYFKRSESRLSRRA
jgi:ABC-type branched-subunit amino acid transport system substrate-binding protein